MWLMIKRKGREKRRWKKSEWCSHFCNDKCCNLACLSLTSCFSSNTDITARMEGLTQREREKRGEGRCSYECVYTVQVLHCHKSKATQMSHDSKLMSSQVVLPSASCVCDPHQGIKTCPHIHTHTTCLHTWASLRIFIMYICIWCM